MRNRVLLTASIVIVTLFIALATAVLYVFPSPDIVVFETPNGSVSFQVVIADTLEEQETGLMFQEEVPLDGMLFVFHKTVNTPFWMKNTLIPLEVAFIDANGKVINIVQMVPCEQGPCPIYYSDAPYAYALETVPGTFASKGIGAGSQIRIQE